MNFCGRTIVVLSGTLVALVACGGPPPAPPKPPEPPPTKPLVVETPIDLSPVPMPDRVVFLAQVKKPNAILKTIGDWAHFPLPGGEALAELVLDKPVGDVFDLDQSIYGVGILSGSGRKAKPTFGGSIALKSFDQAKRQFEGSFSLNNVENGDLEVKGIDDSPADDENHKTCVIAHAAGPSNARLVCTFGPDGAKILPYLARTAVKDVPEKDFHAEVRLGPARDELRMALAMLPAGIASIFGGGSNDAFAEMAEAAGGDVSDFVLDVDRVSLDAVLDDKAFTCELGFGFASRQALTTQVALSHADKVGPPPAAFWHLPSDTDFSVWGSGMDSKLMDHPKDLLIRAISQAAKEKKLPDAESKAFADAFAHSLSFLSSPSLYAKGYDENAVHNAADKNERGDGFPREMVSTTIGWHLWRFEEPIAKVGPNMKEWVSAWNRPGFQKWAKAEMAKDSKDSKEQLFSVRATPVPAALKLPKETVHLEITIPLEDRIEQASLLDGDPSVGGGARNLLGAPDARKGAKPPLPSAVKPLKHIPQKPIVMHVFAVPDAGATTLAIGMDDKLIAGKALTSLSTSPDADTLKGRQGYEVFRDVRATSGGFFTLHALVGLERIGRDPLKRLAGLSNGARTPLVFTMSATQPGDPRGKEGAMTTTFRAPKELVTDIMRLAMK